MHGRNFSAPAPVQVRRYKMIAARRPPAPELAKKFLPPSAIGRMARSAALLLILRPPSSPAKRVKKGDRRFFTAVFLARLSSRATDLAPTRHARMGETKTATPLRRRGLVHAYRIVIQNRREPALNLRDAHAAGVTSLSVYGGWVRRSRRAVLRW